MSTTPAKAITTASNRPMTCVGVRSPAIVKQGIVAGYGAGETPFSAMILVFAHVRRSALRGAYSGELYQAISDAMPGNSIITKR